MCYHLKLLRKWLSFLGEIAYKICVFGESGVGKTTLARRYLTGYFEEDIKLTMGAELFVKYITLENIRVLLSDDNLKKYKATSSFNLSDLKSIRVYIKHKEDYAAIRRVVEKQVVSTEVLYLHDDICRPGFLVEIEGVARK